MSPSSEPSQWMVGLDLSERSYGAMALAKWFAGTPDWKEPFHGLHVVERYLLPPGLQPVQPDLLSAATEAAQEYVEAHGAGELFEQLEVAEGDDASASLFAAAARDDVAGLIIGRRAATDSKKIWRLGRVARRVTRELPDPLIVVPPDFAVPAKGPILVATDGKPAADGAARFAVHLGRRLERPVLFATCVGLLDTSASLTYLPYLPSSSWPLVRSRTLAQASDRVQAWLDELGLGEAEYRTLEGGTVATIAGLATEAEACLVVCGSRVLSGVERLFSASTGMALAGVAAQPVAIIPSDWGS